MSLRPDRVRSAIQGATRIYAVAGLVNFAVTIPAFVAYDWYVGLFTVSPPRYPFLVWIWAGMAFLWGIFFWEIAGDPLEKYPMIKYTYLEKAVTSTSVLVAFVTGDVPARFAVGIVFTDVLWIPVFAAVQWRLAMLRRES